MFVKLLFFSSLYLLTVAYPSGAPEGSCALRIPGHRAEAQKTAAPFKIEATSLGGGRYKLILKSTDDKEFKGFLLAVQDSNKKYVGFFGNATGSKTLNCPQGNALTHIDKVAKKMVDIEWTKPAGFTGDVKILATAVRDYSTFWTDIKAPLTVA